MVLFFQSVLLSGFSFVFAFLWSILINPDRINIRRDRHIIGQNLILVAIAFLGLIAFAYDQPGVKEVISVKYQDVFIFAILSVMIWLMCCALVKFILSMPKGDPPDHVIIITRSLINFCGLAMMSISRYLLTGTINTNALNNLTYKQSL